MESGTADRCADVLWRDGNKAHPLYWAKDHEWKSLCGVEFVTTKHVTWDLMGRVAFALSDEKNTFIAYRTGLSYTKHGNEHIQEDYWEKGLRWDWDTQRERGVIWMAKTRFRTHFQWLGGSDLTTAEAFALLPKFAYLIGAKAVSKGMRQVNRDIAAIRQRRVHRSTAWLVLHRAGIRQTAIHKAIFQQAELLW